MNRLLRILAVVLLLLVRGAPPAGASPRALPAEKIAAIRQAVSEAMSKDGTPGIMAAVGVEWEPVWSAGFGLADVENSIPAKAATVHRLGSISKPITAVAAMQLVEKGALDLDAPIQKYVPSFPEKPWPVTARLLLCHQSGIRHYANQAEVDSTRHYADLREPLRIFQDDPLLFEPGTRYSYTTYGYSLLGAAVEATAGARFADYLRDRVFLPAGMTHTRTDDTYDLVPNRARGYAKTKDGRLRNCSLADTSNKIPGGGMCSTAEDLVRFAGAFHKGLLVRRESVERMTKPQKTSDGKPTEYGLGWFVVERQGQTWVYHTGGQQGTSTVLLTLPRERVAVALMANLEGAREVMPLAVRLAAIVLE